MLGSLLWLLSSVAAAQTPDQAPATDLAEEADLRFRRGSQAYLAGRYEEALEHLLVSNRLVPNRNVLFNIGMAYVQLRDYDAAYRHLAEFIATEERPDARARAEQVVAGFRDQVALVEVVSEPPGASVFVDRRDLGSRGRTPLILAIAPGEHRLILELAGHTPTEVTAVARKGADQSVSATLEAILGTVRIQGGPPGADIRIGEEESPVVGQIPASIDLPAGRHLLVVSAPGHTTERQFVDVQARQVNEALVDLDVVKGRLVVDAVSNDALVEIDGDAAGFTPTVLDVAAGAHRVRITAPGYRPFEADVDIGADASTTLDVRLRPSSEVTAASRSSEAVEDAPASVSIITREEIRAFGYLDVYDALGGTRGVFRTNNLTYKALGFRGFARAEDYGNRVLSTLDGHVLNDDYVGASFVSTDLMTDLLDLDQIEVVRGPGSALYGSNAFFGVVNLVTRAHGSPPRPHAGFVGDQGRTVRGRVGGGAGSEHAGGWLSVAGLQSAGDDYVFPELAGSALVPDGVVEGRDWSRSGTVHGSAWFGDWTVHGFFDARDKAYPTASYGTRPGDPRASVKDGRGFAEARYEPALSLNTRLYTRAWVDYSRFHGQYPYYPRVYVDEWDGTWGGIEPRLVTEPTPWFALTVGAEAKRELVASMDNYIYRNLEEEDLYSHYIDVDPVSATYSGYVLTELGSSLLRAHLGARYDLIDLPAEASDDTLDALSPRLALVSHPTERTAIKLVAGQAFRAPSIYEYVYNDGGFTQLAPESLLPETILTGEAEVTQRFSETASVIVAGYYNRIDDLVDAQLVAGDLLQYGNVDESTQAVGGEVELRREWRDGWMAATQYSVQHTREGELVDGDPIDNSPTHLGSLKVAVPISPDVVTGSTRVIAESPRIGSDGARTRWFLLWDATLTGQVPGLPIQWLVGGRNLLDWRIEWPGGPGVPADRVPQPGRSVVVGISASLPEQR